MKYNIVSPTRAHLFMKTRIIVKRNTLLWFMRAPSDSSCWGKMKVERREVSHLNHLPHCRWHRSQRWFSNRPFDSGTSKRWDWWRKLTRSCWERLSYPRKTESQNRMYRRTAPLGRWSTGTCTCFQRMEAPGKWCQEAARTLVFPNTNRKTRIDQRFVQANG